ncbi:uncharacterized protein LOC129791516 [Lutzomyia longipalpis]|uniref:uncharacterized protein LOC129791516 n=1 Tax=Lutzomyia longipalpis TaxID=7200 RepID=UPI0024843AF0|nr:uncharacterized protein LOC129791516 [Lutzomyia longipalpis]
MKTVYFVLIVSCFLVAPGTNAQEVIKKAITDYLLPCSSEIDLGKINIPALQNGDISGITPVINCVADCISKRLDLINPDGAFQMDNFRQRLGLFILPDEIQSFVESCEGNIGQGKCQISGDFYKCILVDKILGRIFS